MHQSHYLFFTTTCEQALAFYTQCGLGQVVEVLRYCEGNIPANNEAMRGKIMHAKFEGRGVLFYASDNDDAEPMRGSAHILMMDDREQTDRLFGLLGSGGRVTTPLGVQPWGGTTTFVDAHMICVHLSVRFDGSKAIWSTPPVHQAAPPSHRPDERDLFHDRRTRPKGHPWNAGRWSGRTLEDRCRDEAFPRRTSAARSLSPPAETPVLASVSMPAYFRHGPLTLGTVAATGNLTLASTGALDLGTSTVGGNLAATSGNGNVTQDGPLAVTGTTGIVAGTGNIQLKNTGNVLGGKVTTSGAQIDLTDAGPLALGTVAASSNLNVASSGALDLGPGGRPKSPTCGRVKIPHPDAVNRRRSAPS